MSGRGVRALPRLPREDSSMQGQGFSPRSHPLSEERAVSGAERERWGLRMGEVRWGLRTGVTESWRKRERAFYTLK